MVEARIILLLQQLRTDVVGIATRNGYPIPQPRGAYALCVPITSPTSCDQAIFVDQATDLSLFSDAVPVEIDWLG
jgi:hypothetical protein